MSALVAAPPYYGCSVFGSTSKAGDCCASLPSVINITAGATQCQSSNSDSTKQLQTCLLAVSGNTNQTVVCNFSGKSSGAAPPSSLKAGVSIVGTLVLAGMMAVAVLTVA